MEDGSDQSIEYGVSSIGEVPVLWQGQYRVLP